MTVLDNSVETTSYNSQVTSLLPGKEEIQQEDSTSSKAYVLHLTSFGMPRQFNLGMVVHSDFHESRLLSSLAKPGSACSLSDFVVLDRPSQNEEKSEVESSLKKSILADHQDTKIRLGEAGFEELLKSNVDAIFIYVPAELQKECVIRALQARKHVLLNDPVSTSLSEFKEQQECAKQHGKFIQFRTMFFHQFSVRKFFERVLCDERFGEIMNIECNVRVCYKDVEKVGVTLPLGKTDGAIRVLGRFCILVSALFYSRVGIFAHSAKVISAEFGSKGEIVSTRCIVKFTEGRVLEFDVGYTNFATRQSIDILAENRFAQMKDFIIQHPDGLATYRVYDRVPSSSGSMEIVKGEAIDVYGGPKEETIMWRRFAELSQSLDDQGGWDQSDRTAECRELANVALQTKRIIIALEKSVDNSFEEVIIDDIDYE
mmetsp:Transcript_13625/g.32930  ORF Transcript_13625/g.32930 Transcript_13625/m.32930 type:complete len:429 (-) Transcript_13625:1081-2367(-)|eukprot:CAMPEP_0113612974 /NCGR_PEP_ID=MMETSP0017_2-20120614/6394_1 /TAXON_ID=2856 /ORGANISM="Cylindrotheca closterium" /LENGTH=428 /DNA_ID=CAMNT_0000522061 /DNA_START=34 /DNA_END=1320 /DNA_ORIENTATION=+ /assembly_acc=CAM_ASM_000147